MLEGIKVVEYATYMAAPGAGGILADWGASVLKIEPPGGDPARLFFETLGMESDVNPVFEFDNRGKRSIVLDTALEAGRDVLKKLAAGADVFLTNVRPAGLARAGLDYDALAAINPRLVYASVTGYGLNGPDKDRPGFDVAAFWARSGAAAAFAPKGCDPFPIRTAFGDHVTSMATVAGICAALVERERSGRGRLVEASLLRAANYAMGSDLAIQHHFGRLASTRPRHAAVSPLANFFRTRDGRWLCLVPRQGGKDFADLCRAIERPDLAEDSRFKSARGRREHVAELVTLLDEAFARFDFADLAARLDAVDFVWAPVQTPAEAVADPQLAAAGGIVEMKLADGRKIKSPASPVRFPGEADAPLASSPTIGEHTRAVLTELGYTETAIAQLFESGTVKAGK